MYSVALAVPATAANAAAPTTALPKMPLFSGVTSGLFALAVLTTALFFKLGFLLLATTFFPLVKFEFDLTLFSSKTFLTTFLLDLLVDFTFIVNPF